MANLTKVYLLNVPIENDYKNTIHFDTKSEQYEYFINKRISTSMTDCSYQRKDGIIRVDAQFDEVIKCNYVMYQNTAYSDKWYYAFVTDIQYVSDGRTDLTIETDVMQTWYFDVTVQDSFVEREHVDDDTIGKHTVPEMLETGEYVCNTHRRDTNLDNLDIVMGATVDVSGDNISGTLHNGIYSGVGYCRYDSEDLAMINDTITVYAGNGKSDAITCLFMAPKFLTGVTGTEPDDVFWLPKTTEPKTYDLEYDKDYYMDGYANSIKNNKLFTYPYNYLLCSNMSGGSAIYLYEHFKPYVDGSTTKNKIKFRVTGALTPGCSIRLTPLNYKNTTENDDEGLNLGKYPVCNWTSDVYTNWLTQNSVNLGISMVSGVAQIAGGVAMTVGSGGLGAVVGGGSIAGGVSTIANTLAQVHTQSFTPPQSQGNLNCGDVVTSMGKNSFHFYNMSIKKEYAQIIDEFFTMFGYKVNRVKKPNRKHRSRFWYTKTIDVNIDGAIPQKDLQKIRECYDRGITFWRKGTTINDYTSANTIV